MAEPYTAAAQQGIEVPDFVFVDPEDPLVPHYNPEVIPLTLFPVYRDDPPDWTRAVRALPGEVTVLEAGAVFLFFEWHDPRDVQSFKVLDEDGHFPSERASPTLTLATGTPDLVRYHPDSEKFRLWAPEEPGTYSLHLMLHMPGGGSAWETFEFEVRAP